MLGTHRTFSARVKIPVSFACELKRLALDKWEAAGFLAHKVVETDVVKGA